MRLVASGSAEEIRLTYEPVLFRLLSQPLIKKSNVSRESHFTRYLDSSRMLFAQDGIAEVISLMDDYFLGTEDRESILELGVDKNNGEEVLKKIPNATKTAFTRTYNSSNQ